MQDDGSAERWDAGAEKRCCSNGNIPLRASVRGPRLVQVAVCAVAVMLCGPAKVLEGFFCKSTLV